MRESEATWNVAASGTPWQVPGAAGPQDRDATLVGSVNATSTGSFTFALNAAGVALIQGWIDDPTSNHGLVIADTSTTDGLDFTSRQAASAGDGPRLSIDLSSQPFSNDNDGDGMQNDWEIFFGFDPQDPSDDPAVWLHPFDPSESRVIGTDKQRGLVVYDLAGSEVQALLDGGTRLRCHAARKERPPRQDLTTFF